ncbi:MAG: 4Fe-4S dicluster domain-containing protein [Thermodesulfobacteriota bacterium]
MTEYTEKIREISKKLLIDKSVDLIIGFRKGTVPMMNEPCFIKHPDEVGRLVWDSHCGINLANYLPNRKERIGILAKGCDSRNIAIHIVENKIKRNQIKIIGIPCRGMLDKRKIASSVSGEIVEAVEDKATVKVSGNGFSTSFDKQEMLQENCKVCKHRNPVIYDELVAEPVPEQQDVDPYEDVRRIEGLSDSEKRKFFEDLISECIRCYACRNACPLCYCPTCFVDESRPQWVGKSIEPTDTLTFHFLRAYHCAGRCTDCGACERACPVGIRVRQFTKKLNKDCFDLYGWEAGLTIDERPPLDTYRPQDPNDFIK